MSTRSAVVLAIAALLLSCQRQTHAIPSNGELEELFEADQADRHRPPETIDWASVTPRDEARRRRVKTMLESGSIRTPEDFYRAAMIYQHGSTPPDIHTARELALRAIELRPDFREAKWLAAAALDRELMIAG